MEFLGTTYKGDIKDGRFSGKGTYGFQTGTKYVGELKDGMFHGKGRKLLSIFFSACNITIYMKKGALHFENGSKYDAIWVEGIATEVKET